MSEDSIENKNSSAFFTRRQFLKTLAAGMAASMLKLPDRPYRKESEPDYSKIRSVTYYQFPRDKPSELIEPLVKELPKIKDAGFNCIWLVLPWHNLQPEAGKSLDIQQIESVKQILSTLKAREMRAIIGLNYLGEGWSPKGIDHNTWLTKPEQFQGFVQYTKDFLTSIQEYSDNVEIFLFTENCGDATAGDFKKTLGSLPLFLPPELRQKFRFVLHDFKFWKENKAVLNNPRGFSGVSTAVYEMESYSNEEILNRVHNQSETMRFLYPDHPLILGEVGASKLGTSSETNQARVLSIVARYAKKIGYGINFWSWKPPLAPTEEKREEKYALTNLDGTPTPALKVIEGILKPTHQKNFRPQIG